MMRTNRVGAARRRDSRWRDAIVTAVVTAMLVLCSGRGSAWAMDKPAPAPSAAPATAAIGEGPASGATATEAPTGPSLADTYAAREASARDLENFRGGDVVIVGTTGLIVVLLVIIIL